MSQIKILLVDDHAVVRMGFKMLIEAETDIKVIGEAESGEAAVKLFQELKPDIIVMDITMPGIGGLEAIDRIMAKDKNTKILVLSAHEDSVHPKRVLNAGAMGYLTKRSAAEELLTFCFSLFGLFDVSCLLQNLCGYLCENWKQLLLLRIYLKNTQGCVFCY